MTETQKSEWKSNLAFMMAMIGSAVIGNGSTKRQMKKTANKAMKTISDVIDGIQSMM